MEEDVVCSRVDDVADDPAQHQRPHDHLQRGGDGGVLTKVLGGRCEGPSSPTLCAFPRKNPELPVMSPAWEMSAMKVNR